MENEKLINKIRTEYANSFEKAKDINTLEARLQNQYRRTQQAEGKLKELGKLLFDVVHQEIENHFDDLYDRLHDLEYKLDNLDPDEVADLRYEVEQMESKVSDAEYYAEEADTRSREVQDELEDLKQHLRDC
jgi:predicted  nucleic acid-binding Zn-ribbon protein